MAKSWGGAFCAAVAAAWMFEAPAHAEDTDAGTAKAPEVIVTGSRVRPRDLAASSPVVTVAPTEFQKAGALTVETLLSQYPQFSPSYSEAANNPDAGGAAYLDLRGLGTNRTLVLVDGRRTIGSDSSNVVDVNTIPASLIQKVEIVSGGASAVYGPDAVAGVVNFILRRDFEGAEFDLDGVISGRNDAARKHAALTVGRALLDQKLHAIFSFDYADRDELGRAERGFSSQASSASPAYPGGAYVTGANPPSLAAVNAVFAGYGVGAGLVPRNGGFGGFGFNPDGTLFSSGIRFNPIDAQNVRLPDIQIAKKLYPDVIGYNFEPENKLILPLERFSGTALLTYKPNDRLELYSDILLTRYQASTALAASPAPTGPNPAYPANSGVTLFTIPVTNPFIPADLKTLLASRTGDSPALAGSGPNEDFLYKFRSTSLGPRQTRNTTDVYNVTLGVKWRALPDWVVESYVSLGRYDRDQAQAGNLLTRKLQQLLNSPTGGTEYCAGGFNPFGQGLSKACGAYVRTGIDNRTAVEQQIAAATATGPLFSLPAGRVRASLGLEHRHVTFRFDPDPNAKPGEIAGFNGVDALSGSTTSNDAFAEVFVPILRDLPLVRSFDATVGYRRVEGYGSGSNSYKAELRWTPVETLSVRGSYQRAVRAPSVFELYSPATLGSVDIADPCSASNPLRTAQVLALCKKQAASAGFGGGFVDGYESDGSMGTLLSGSTKIDPEKANTYTLGVVWQPRSPTPWLTGVRLALDGWWIRVKGVIANRDALVVVNGCYNLQGSTNPTYDPGNFYCQQLTRSSSDFQVINLLQPEVNQSLYSLRGIDLTAGATVPAGEMTRWPWLGRLTLNLMLGWIDRWDEQDSPYAPSVNFAGTIGNSYGLATPRWKGILTAGWRYGDWEAEVRTRYIGAMENAFKRAGLFTGATGADPTWYVDLSARWRVRDGLELSAGVLNALDQDPRTFIPALDASTDPSTYDVIGRRFRAGVNVRW